MPHSMVVYPERVKFHLKCW